MSHDKTARAFCTLTAQATENYRDMMVDMAAIAATSGVDGIAEHAIAAAAHLDLAAARMRESGNSGEDLDAFFALFKQANEPINNALNLAKQAADTEDSEAIERILGLISIGAVIANFGPTIASLVNNAHNAWVWPTADKIIAANKRMKAKESFEAGLKNLIKGMNGVLGDGDGDISITRMELDDDDE